MSKLKYNQRFCFHDLIQVHLEGTGNLASYLNYQYQYFSDERSLDIDRVKARICSCNYVVPDISLKNGKEEYSIDKTNTTFIWKVSGRKMLLDGTLSLFEQKQVSFEPRFDRMKANLIIDLLLRFKFSSKDIALVHAACVAKDGQATLLPAWKGMRKTAACLKIIQGGYDFLADDRVWIKSNGEVLAYPRYVVLKDSNVSHFPEFTSPLTKIRLFLIKAIEKFTNSDLFRVPFRVLSRVLKISAKYYYINDLYPNAKVASQAFLEKIVFLSKQKKLSQVRLENITDQTIISNSCLIGNVEWNYALLTIASAHDILFVKGPRWVEEVLSLIKKEKNIVSQSFKEKKCLIASLPEEDKKVDWYDLCESIDKL